MIKLLLVVSAMLAVSGEVRGKGIWIWIWIWVMDRERWIWTSWIIPVKSTPLLLPMVQVVTEMVLIKRQRSKIEKRGKD